MALDYFAKIIAAVFHGGPGFISHRGRDSISEMQQMNFSAELCCTNGCYQNIQTKLQGTGSSF